MKTRFEVRNGRGVLVKLAEVGSFNDREVKPQNIHLHIGRRPIFAFSNSDGDLAMLRYAKSASGAAWRCSYITTMPSAGSRMTANFG